MSGDLDLLKSTMRDSTEALAHAQEIKAKIENDNERGYFDPAEKVERTTLAISPDFIEEGLKLLKKTYGIQLASYLCGQDDTKQFSKWIRGERPGPFQAHKIRTAIDITNVLLGKFTAQQASEWWTTPCDYLMGWLPLDEIRGGEELVRRAALKLLT